MKTPLTRILILCGALLCLKPSVRADEVSELPGLDHVILWRDLVLAWEGIAHNENYPKAQREYIGSLVVPLIFKGWLSLRHGGKQPMTEDTFREFAKKCYERALEFHKKFAGEARYLQDPLRILRYYKDGELQKTGIEELRRRDVRNLRLDEKFKSEAAYREVVSAFHKDLGIVDPSR